MKINKTSDDILRQKMLSCLYTARSATQDMIILVGSFNQRGEYTGAEKMGAELYYKVLSSAECFINSAVSHRPPAKPGAPLAEGGAADRGQSHEMREKQATRNRPPAEISRINVSEYLEPKKGGGETC